ncbi:MAG: PadR family transcriptional regulator, partial [Acidimicrobiia bacterium]
MARISSNRISEQEGATLPTTSFAVLGLLTFGEHSGYELHQLVEQSIGFFLTPAKSQIYAELRRLVSLGYAVEREVEQDRRPDKRVY